MSIYDKARDLADEILKTKEAKKFLEMKYILDGDIDAQEKLNNFEKLKKEIKIKRNSLTKEELEQKNKELEDITAQIKEDIVLKDYFLAEKEFNTLVNSAMDIFNATLFGEFEDEDATQGGCCGSGGCAGCSGC